MLQPVHVFQSYYKPHAANRKTPVGLVRDGIPSWNMMAALAQRGYVIGQTLLNFPPPYDRPGEMLEMDCEWMRPIDTVLTCTRVVLSEEERSTRKNIPKGYTSLEAAIVRYWRFYLLELTRKEMILQPWLRGKIRANYENRRSVHFREGERAEYSELNACDGSRAKKVKEFGRTAAFLLNQPALWENGPRYLGAFGMSNDSTLAFSHLLRTRHSDLLLRPGFQMFELTSVPIAERVYDLRWADEWSAEVILSVPPVALVPEEPRPERNTISGQTSMEPRLSETSFGI